MGWLKDVLRGGSDELGWDDLVRRIVDAVAPLRSYGPKGEVAFPDGVVVRITVPDEGLGVTKSFLDKPELDREVGAALANKCDVAVGSLPPREYLLSTADRITVTAGAGAPKTWSLRISGGDRDGAALAFPAHSTECVFGRGPDSDLPICDRTEFVSRRAGVLYRAGHVLEVAALDQGDELVVRRTTGETIRPARTARGRIGIAAGDTIELGDGKGGAVKLLLERG